MAYKKYQRTHATEFPRVNIPAEILRLVASGKITDTSWGNDAFPSFALCEDGSARLWVADEIPGDREVPTSRYVVAGYDEDDNWLDDPIATDDLAELLDYLDDHWDIR